MGVDGLPTLSFWHPASGELDRSDITYYALDGFIVDFARKSQK
jgi:hypothetical protein